jgi:hypothetical protein
MATFRNSSTSANQYTQLEFIAGSRDAYIWLGNQNTTSWAGDGGLNIYTGTGNMDFWTAATQKMRLTAGGNLGIGTTSPANKLDVVGDGIRTSADQSTSAFLVLSGTSTEGRITVSSYGSYQPMTFYTGGSERIRITTGGNVGIGTTNPGAKLDVVGAALFGNTASGLYVSPSQVHIGGTGTAQLSLEDVGVATAAIALDGNTFAFGHQDSGPAYQFKYSNTYNGNYASTGTTFVQFNPTTNYINSGNVGIGTSDPSVGGTVGSKFTIIQSDNSTAIAIYSGTSRRFAINPISNGGFTLFDGGNATFNSGITQLNGNVGIGTTAPSVALHIARTAAVSPSIRLHTTDSTTNGSIQWTNSTNSMLAFIGSNANIGDGSGNLEFATGGTTTRMVINSAGNVGIGTNTPGAKLDVNGDAWFTNAGNLNAVITQGATGKGRLYLYDGGSATIGLQTNGVSYFNAGNVGIGTTSPGLKLEVVGGASLAGTAYATLRAVQDQTNYRGVVLGYDTSGQIGIIYPETPSAASTLAFWTYTGSSWGERMRIASSGNVGIGVTAPAAKLQVSGSSNVLNVRGSGSAATSSIFSVDGTNGRLFEVSDDLSNSLFSVNTIAGLPVIEAFADYTVTMGTYGAYTLQVTGSRVGVGTSSPGYPLHVSGSVSGISIYATNDIAAFSDQSVKTDLQVIDSAVDRIKQINGYTYVRVDDLSNTRRAGVIAQEVQKVLPEVVSENNDGTLNVAYSNMIALLIEGMKEQQSQIDKLREDLEDLRYEL